MSEPMKVQVVFQGGGAKLCALIAAAHALQDLEKDDLISVTRLAGTSAGAIAACLFASEMPMETVRERLRMRGPKFVDKIAPTRSKLGIAWRIARSRPIYDEAELRRFLEGLFTHDGRRFDRFAQLRRPVMLTASDLLNSQKIVAGAASDFVIQRIVDSCALPFAFRTARVGGTVVDGGICENLPVDELIAEQATLGRVLGFSFDHPPGGDPPQGFLCYAIALLNTAINNSMQRAARTIGEDRVFRIQTRFGIFDFRDALADGLADDHYQRVRSQCRDWLHDMVGRARVAEPGAQTEMLTPSARLLPAHDLAERIHAVHQRQQFPGNFRIARSALIVTANCLLSDNDARSELPDGIVQEVELHPQGRPLHSFSLCLKSSGTSPVQGATTWRLLDASGQPCDYTAIPVCRRDDAGQELHQMVFFFHPPLECGDKAPYRLVQSNGQFNTLRDIAASGSDWLRMKSQNLALIELFDIVVYLPEAYQQVDLSELPDNLRVDAKKEPMPWTPGRKMTCRELMAYPLPPKGFVAKGWRATNVPNGHSLGVLFSRVGPASRRP